MVVFWNIIKKRLKIKKSSSAGAAEQTKRAQSVQVIKWGMALKLVETSLSPALLRHGIFWLCVGLR
jgi:hypothetical protein